MTSPNLYIIDDGTLDTVVACATCGWEGRYDPDPCTGHAPVNHPSKEWRGEAALERAKQEHECEG